MKVLYHNLMNRVQGPRAGSNVLIFRNGVAPQLWAAKEDSTSAVINCGPYAVVAVVNEGDVLAYREVTHYPRTVDIHKLTDLDKLSLNQFGPHFNPVPVLSIPASHKRVEHDRTLDNISIALAGEAGEGLSLKAIRLNVDIRKAVNDSAVSRLEREGYTKGLDGSCYYKFSIYTGDLRIYLLEDVRDKAFALVKGIEVVPKGLIIDTEALGLSDSIAKLFNAN